MPALTGVHLGVGQGASNVISVLGAQVLVRWPSTRVRPFARMVGQPALKPRPQAVGAKVIVATVWSPSRQGFASPFGP